MVERITHAESLRCKISQQRFYALNELLSFGKEQGAERARQWHPSRGRNAAPTSLVHEYHVGLQFERQHNGLAFSSVQALA